MRVACRGAQWQHARVDGVCVRGGVYQLTSDTRLKNIVVMRDTRECTYAVSIPHRRIDAASHVAAHTGVRSGTY